MKQELKDIILNSVPKKYHKKVKSVIDEYNSTSETYFFRINLLIILAAIVFMLLVILRALIGG